MFQALGHRHSEIRPDERLTPKTSALKESNVHVSLSHRRSSVGYGEQSSTILTTTTVHQRTKEKEPGNETKLQCFSRERTP